MIGNSHASAPDSPLRNLAENPVFHRKPSPGLVLDACSNVRVHATGIMKP